MARVIPLQREQVKDLKAVFEITEAVMGFVPNSMLIMARDPDLLAAFAQLSAVVMVRPGKARPRLEVAHYVRREPPIRLPILHGPFGPSCNFAWHSFTQGGGGVQI